MTCRNGGMGILGPYSEEISTKKDLEIGDYIMSKEKKMNEQVKACREVLWYAGKLETALEDAISSLQESNNEHEFENTIACYEDALDALQDSMMKVEFDEVIDNNA